MSDCVSTVIDQEEYSESAITENFLNTFQLLSAKQKKIWQVLQWFATNYRCVFPSQGKIAEKAGCTRDTVNRALKLFEKNGWIYSIWRCFRSKVYCLLNFLLKFDTRKNETFRRNQTENQTANQTLCNPYASACNVRYASTQENRTGTVQEIDPEKKQILREIGIVEPKDVWCLARYSPRILRLAQEDKKTRVANGPIRNLAAWITDRCKALKAKYGGSN